MKKNVRLTESDLNRLVRKIVKETEESADYSQSPINKIMEMAYEVMGEIAPDGPRNKEEYMSGVEELERLFNYTIRNLRGNVGQ